MRDWYGLTALEQQLAHAKQSHDYRDPLPGFEGCSLAGFAPVGSTGFVVLVQSRFDEATRASRVLAEAAAPIGSLALTVLVLLWLLAFRVSRRRCGQLVRHSALAIATLTVLPALSSIASTR
jgi:hypothetical protein